MRGRVGSWIKAAGGGAVAVTMMACYGVPPDGPYPDDSTTTNETEEGSGSEGSTAATSEGSSGEGSGSEEGSGSTAAGEASGSGGDESGGSSGGGGQVEPHVPR